MINMRGSSYYDTEIGTMSQVQILDEAVCISQHTNVLGNSKTEECNLENL